jgi:2-octaprenyl-6-methoxyphenol hydroxylase
MQYDIIIIGGGMVGASLACALQNTSLRIALIDASKQTVPDHRLIALTHSSCTLLKNLELWPSLQQHATPIKQIHVSHQGHFGITRIHASEVNLDTLGHLIPAKYINAALDETLKNSSHVDIFRPATLKTLSPSDTVSVVTIETETGLQTLHAQLIVGADGTYSTVRELVNIPIKTIDYQQSALVTVTELQRTHHHIAYERFRKKGAIAMLPLTENRCATIWTEDNAIITEFMQMSDAAFLKKLQAEFGYRLGRFQKTGPRYQYPLKFIVAEKNQQQNVILIGNAAHTMHPIAAQGLNLSLFEIAELTEAIQNHSSTTLATLTIENNLQQRISTQLSHELTRLFSTDFFIFNSARQLGMMGLDACLTAKRFFMKKTLGKAGKTPYLLQEKEYHESNEHQH